jgi:hypothetical protein
MNFRFISSSLPLFILLFFGACSDDAIHDTVPMYFDSESYFSQEATRLGNLTHTVVKYIQRNKETDSSAQTVRDWKKELEPFRQCNIAKPSMKNSYQADTTMNGDLITIRYTALEDKLVVRNAVVVREGQKIRELHFTTQEENELYRTTRQLDYFPETGYTITGSQKVVLGNKTGYSVKAQWR